MRMSEGIAPTLMEGISEFHNVFFFLNLSSLYGFCFKIHNRCERQVVCLKKKRYFEQIFSFRQRPNSMLYLFQTLREYNVLFQEFAYHLNVNAML